MTITGGTDIRGAGAPVLPARRSSVRRWPDVVTALGLLVVVAGTFLPWLRSGSSERTSYSADGALRGLLDLHDVSGVVLMAWPFLPLACAVALGLLIVRLQRSGTVVAAVGAVAAGVVCIRVLATHSSVIVSVATLGPAVTLAGCSVALVGAVLVVCSRATSGRVVLSHRSGRI